MQRLGFLVGVMFLSYGLSLFLDIPFLDIVLFASIISATDPIAVGSILKQFSLPKRLELLVEGESLMNDGTALALFTVLFAVVFEGRDVSLFGVSWRFVWAIGGAIPFGWVFGRLMAWLMGRWHESEFVQTLMTIVLAYVTFLIGEHVLHVSGVISVMFAAIIFSNCPHAAYCTRSEVFDHFWSFIAGITNSVLFFLFGSDFGITLF